VKNLGKGVKMSHNVASILLEELTIKNIFVESGEDVLVALLGSDRVREDIVCYKESARSQVSRLLITLSFLSPLYLFFFFKEDVAPFALIFRDFEEQLKAAQEFRVFVEEARPVAISQYHYFLYFNELRPQKVKFPLPSSHFIY